MAEQEHPLTVVSGYWVIKNKHDDEYLKWFKNTLAIQCPYVFFGNKESIKIAKRFRPAPQFVTHYVVYNITEFETYKYKDRMITDPRHCPSQELNLVWNEKIFMIAKVKALNPFKSEFFAWIDAGISEYRDRPPPPSPFPNRGRLASLPKDRLLYNATQNGPFNPALLDMPNYHYVAGTAFLLHVSLVDRMVELYRATIDRVLSTNKLYSDQMIFSHILKDHPQLFCCAGYYYGKLVPLLYT